MNWHQGAHDMKFGGEFLRVQRHQELVAEPPRHLRLQHAAVGRRAGAPLPGRRLGRPVALGHQRPRAVPAAVRHQLPPRLPGRHRRGRRWRCGSATTGASASNLSVNFGVRYDADWGATNPPRRDRHGDHDRQRPRVGRLRLQDRHPRPEQRRAARRLCLQRRRQRRPGDSRRQRPLLQHAGVERDLQPPVLQPARSRRRSCRTGPGFMENPTRGVTAEDYLSGSGAGAGQAPRIIADDYVMPYSWQSSIGFQKQLGRGDGLRRRPDLPRRAQPGARPRPEPVLRSGHRLQPRSGDRSGGPIRSTARSSGWRARARPRPLLLATLVHAPVQEQLPGRRHLHAHPAPQRQHHRLRHPGQQPVRPRRRLVALDRLPARHVPRQRHRQPAVADDASAPRSSTDRAATTTPRCPAGRTASRARTA